MKAASKLLKLLILFNIVLLTVACNYSKIEAITVVGSEVVAVGKSTRLEIVTEPEDARYRKVEWSSSNSEIATVKAGKVRGIAPGTVEITAKIGDLVAKHEMRVVDLSAGGEIFAGYNIIGNVETDKLIEISLLERSEGYIAANFNPYDYDTLNIYADFTAPGGKTWRIPAFWFRDYYFTFDETYTHTSGISGVASTDPDEPQGLEMVEWMPSAPHYRFRLKPDEAGRWTAKIYVEQCGIITQIMPLTLDVAAGDGTSPGVIAVDSTNHRFFRYRNGESFVPVGINLGWWTSSARKTYDYQVWMERMSENNMNFARIWMATWGFALHWGDKYNNFDDRQNSAARLDRVLGFAEENGIYIMLTLINHGQFSSEVNAEWRHNPYNIANGGILAKPQYFFSNQQARSAYKNELMYIIGRYAYSDNIMAWELFNEVNWTDNYNINIFNVYNWHKEMARFLKENDYREHLVTTSYNSEEGSAYLLSEIDFINPHSYGYGNKNINAVLPSALNRLFNKYEKPVIQSEIGINWQNGAATAAVDPTGITLRQGAWAGMMGGGAGGAMHWWWDSWVHPNDLYYQFKGAGAYAARLDLSGEFDLLATPDVIFGNNSLRLLGYRYPDRIYGYIYDTRWIHSDDKSEELNNVNMRLTLTAGSYRITFYNALTGAEIKTEDFTVNGSYYDFTLPDFCSDLAFIINTR